MSPVSGVDVAGGDVSYTEALVARPPHGVTYTTYVDALSDGTLVERGRRPKHGPLGTADAAVLAARGVELGLRRSRLMFREPYRYLTVDPDAFDLVHAHLFSVRLVGSRIPLVTSSGRPLPVLYEDFFHWSHAHVVAATWAERLLARTVGAEVSWFPPRHAACTMVQSEHYRHLLVEAGADPGRVVARALGTDGTAGRPRTGPPRTVGFVSTTFEEKGGQVVLAAFSKVVAEHPDARLLIVGSAPRPVPTLPGGAVEWLGRVPRDELLAVHFPRIDVLALPTMGDSGTPYVIQEALQRGVPVVTSDLSWLDEGLTGPGVRRVPVDPDQVADALLELLDVDTYAGASAAAVELWASRYSMDVVAEQVGETYRAVLGSPP